MSDLSRTVEIIFQGTDSISSEIQTMGGNIENFGKEVESFASPFTTVGQAIAGLNLAIAGIATAAIAMRSDFEAEVTKMGNALQVPEADLEAFKDLAKDIFKSGFADSVQDAFSKVTTASKSFKDASIEDLQSIITKASLVSSTFDVDFGTAISSTKSVMKDFKVDSETALNAIGYAMSQVADPTEMTETINEYAGLFAEAGADINDFFNTILAGYDDSTLGTDKVADMFKEFGVKIREGSDEANTALEKLGIDPAALKENIGTGKTTIFDAFTDIIGKLGEVENKNDAFVNGVALMGSPYEDLGTKAVSELGKILDKSVDVTDKMKNLVPEDTISKSFSNLAATIRTDLIENDVWDDIENKIKTIFTDMKPAFEQAVKDTDFNSLIKTVEGFIDQISDHFADMDLDLTTAQGMGNALELIVGGIEGVVRAGSGFYEAMKPVITFGKEAYEWFADLNPETQELIGYISGLGTELGILGTTVAVGGTLLAGMGALAGILSGPGGLLALLATGTVSVPVAMAFAYKGQEHDNATTWGDAIGADINAINTGELQGYSVYAEYKKGNTVFDKVKDWWDSLDGDVKAFATGGAIGYAINANLNTDEIDGISVDVGLELSDDAIDELYSDLDSGLDMPEVPIDVVPETESFDAFYDGLLDPVDIKTQADETSLGETQTRIEKVGERADGTPITIEIPVTEEGTGINDIANSIEKDIPSEKLLEIKLQGEIDTQIALIESSAKTAEAAFQYTADVEIAKAQAAASVLKSAFDNIGTSVESLSGSVSSMFGDLMSNWSNLNNMDQSKFTSILEDQQDAQNKALESQIKLNDAQIEYLNQKANAMNNGDAMINISSDGLEPALEMIMWQIIEKVQIKASEESADFLLGIS